MAPLVLVCPYHLLDIFWGPQDGFFGFSSGGYRERGAGVAFSLQLSLQQHPVKNVLTTQAEMGQTGRPKAGTKSEKWPKMTKK